MKIVGYAFLVCVLLGQSDFFGYYEAELDQFQFRGQRYNFGYNKLRVDVESRPGEQTMFGANLNIQRFFGKRAWNLFDFLPESIWKPIFQPDYLADSLWITEMPVTMGDTLYLDNVYFKAQFNRFDLTIGKQQISLGTGYAWNPLDIFNRIQLLDPTYEQTGINAIRLEALVFNRMSIDIIVAPDSSRESSARMIQGKIGLGSFDFTGSYTEYKDLYPYWRILTSTGNPPTQTTYNVLGGSMVGQIWEFGLWSEGVWDIGNGLGDFEEYLIGIDHTFDFRTYIMFEYYHNSAGANTSNLHFDDYLYYFNGETHSLMQDYIFTYANQPITGFLTLGIFGIINLNDESAVINTQLDWNPFEDVIISLLYSRFIGPLDTEFGLQENGWRLRMRAYF